MTVKSRFYTDKQGRVRFVGKKTISKSTSQLLHAPVRGNKGNFITTDDGRTVFLGGPSVGGGSSIGNGTIVPRMTNAELLATKWNPGDGVVPMYHDTNALPESILEKGILAGANRDVYLSQAPRKGGESMYKYTIEVMTDLKSGQVFAAGGRMNPLMAYERPDFNEYKTDIRYNGVWHTFGANINPTQISRIVDNETGKVVFSSQNVSTKIKGRANVKP